MPIEKWIATYRITTPAFVAGGNQQQAELRTSSFKGALRFWFRALAWGKWGDIEKIRAEEDELFGSTRTGQSRVLISIRPIPNMSRFGLNEKLDNGRGYLAGQGIARFDKKQKTEQNSAGRDKKKLKTKRQAIDHDQQFEVTLIVRPPLSVATGTVNAPQTASPMGDERSVLLKDSLKALGLFGGFGSRSRRAFGSLTLQSLCIEKSLSGASLEGATIWGAPPEVNQLQAEIVGLFSRNGVKQAAFEPPYTAFSATSRVLLIPAQSNERPQDLHERLGKAFQHFRSYGEDGRVGDNNALRIFKGDHNAMGDIAHDKTRGTERAPKRAVFGLPHNYFFSSTETKVDVNVDKRGGDKHDRRGSPLFFHIHCPAGGAPTAVIAFLQAQFLPPNTMLKATKGKKWLASLTLPAAAELWAPIHLFLDSLKDPKVLDKLKATGSTPCETFQDVLEIKL